MPPYLVWSKDSSTKQAKLERLSKAAAHLSNLRVIPVQPESAPAIATHGASSGILSAALADAKLSAPRSAIFQSIKSPIMSHPAPAGDGLERKKLSRQEIALEAGVPVIALSHLKHLSTQRDETVIKAPAKARKDTSHSAAVTGVGLKGGTPSDHSEAAGGTSSRKKMVPATAAGTDGTGSGSGRRSSDGG